MNTHTSINTDTSLPESKETINVQILLDTLRTFLDRKESHYIHTLLDQVSKRLANPAYFKEMRPNQLTLKGDLVKKPMHEGSFSQSEVSHIHIALTHIYQGNRIEQLVQAITERLDHINDSNSIQNRDAKRKWQDTTPEQKLANVIVEQHKKIRSQYPQIKGFEPIDEIISTLKLNNNKTAFTNGLLELIEEYNEMGITHEQVSDFIHSIEPILNPSSYDKLHRALETSTDSLKDTKVKVMMKFKNKILSIVTDAKSFLFEKD